jgi:hypothetical protein
MRSLRRPSLLLPVILVNAAMERGAGGVAGIHEVLEPRLEKTRVFKKKNQPSGFFGFFWVILFYIFAHKREF